MGDKIRCKWFGSKQAWVPYQAVLSKVSFCALIKGGCMHQLKRVAKGQGCNIHCREAFFIFSFDSFSFYYKNNMTILRKQENTAKF